MFRSFLLVQEVIGAYQQRPVSSIPPIASNGFELSRPACFSESFSRFSIKKHNLQFSPSAGSAAANG
jgi:hypothetical protein